MSQATVLQSSRTLTSAEIVRAIEQVRLLHPQCRLTLPDREDLTFRPGHLPGLDVLPPSFSVTSLYAEIDLPAPSLTAEPLISFIDWFRSLTGGSDFVRIGIHLTSRVSSPWVQQHTDGELYLTVFGRRADLDVRVHNDPRHDGKPEAEFSCLQRAYRDRVFAVIITAADLPMQMTHDATGRKFVQLGQEDRWRYPGMPGEGAICFQCLLEWEPTPRLVNRLLAAVDVFGSNSRPRYQGVVAPGPRDGLAPLYTALQTMAGMGRITRVRLGLWSGAETLEAIRLLLAGTRKSVRVPLGSLHLPRTPEAGFATAHVTAKTRATGHDIAAKILGDAGRLGAILDVFGLDRSSG
jgi:hypothetical protein